MRDVRSSHKAKDHSPIFSEISNDPVITENQNDSSTSSVGGYVSISDFITEEAPIAVPKEKNQAI